MSEPKTNWRDIQKRIDNFVDKWPGSDYGPAHITLADSNLADHHLLFCIRETFLQLEASPDGMKANEHRAVLKFLIDLAGIPEDDREEPEQIAWTDGSATEYYCYPGDDPNEIYHKANWERIGE